jgi:hypothetical protein
MDQVQSLFRVMSRKVGQSPGVCSLVQPNTGHCRGLSADSAWLPPVVDDSPSASKAALAALLAALLFLFPPGIAAIVLTDGFPHGGCAMGALMVSEPLPLAAPVTRAAPRLLQAVVPLVRCSLWRGSHPRPQTRPPARPYGRRRASPLKSSPGEGLYLPLRPV